MKSVIEERTAQGRGQGIYALESFTKGDILYLGVLDDRPITNHSHASQISKTRFGFHKGLGSKFNHSCDPNCGIMLNATGGHNIVAMRDIAAEDEATYDYAMRNYRIEHFTASCGCGHAKCRGSITGWKDLPQQRKDDYAGFVAPYLIEMDAETTAIAPHEHAGAALAGENSARM
ncbi:SET domain-containing methyltransferase [uncultured Erythrobacter sp.]|uniref:SET domain-containing protein-lysine N-methyltransferase n=1 Tax=uncultured Erythrobacter sp. TaxID=263913 RepID=UPI002619185F|nr:SET domain-containing methyltransferase [uncultured Erythrobacter sp.]